MKTLLARQRKEVEHHAALPFVEAPEFMAALRERDSLSARALEFTIVTAARTAETIGARWNEIDLEHKVWMIPEGRMKAGREHRVPLSDRAVEILKGREQKRKSDFVFGSAVSGKPLPTWQCLSFCAAC